MELNNNVIISIVSVGVSILAAALGYFLVSTRRKAFYDKEHGQAKLDEVRSSIEKQMYTLNERLVQSEERWRDVNHLLLRDEQRQPGKARILSSRNIHYSEFLKANGIIEKDLIVDKRLVFVLTPFNDMFAKDYKVIREACLNTGFNCVRGDETPFKGDIFPEMLKLILRANLIIANLNGRSPNVLYELGIAHALDKYVILTAREPEELPIDIKSKLFLIYKTDDELQTLIRRELLNISKFND